MSGNQIPCLHLQVSTAQTLSPPFTSVQGGSARVRRILIYVKEEEMETFPSLFMSIFSFDFMILAFT